MQKITQARREIFRKRLKWKIRWKANIIIEEVNKPEGPVLGQDLGDHEANPDDDQDQDQCY